MTRAGLLGLLAGAIAALVVAGPASAGASSDTTGAAKQSRGLTAEEFSAQSRRILHRNPRRIPVYRHSPGPNSVRICNAHYEQEFRPSGTVIVPRMQCYWSG